MDVAGETRGLHLHLGGPEETGGVLYDLAAGAGVPAQGFTSPVEGAVAFDADDLTALNSGGLYINLHSADHTGGEIRGQVDFIDGANIVDLADAEVKTGVDFSNEYMAELRKRGLSCATASEITPTSARSGAGSTAR